MTNEPREKRKPVDLDILWSSDQLGFAGRGKILDLSANGARIQLNRLLPIPVGSSIAIDSRDFAARMPTARVRWTRHIGSLTQCGIEFLSTGTNWESWVAEQGEVETATDSPNSAVHASADGLG